jgi:hypothetical protein
MGLRVIEWVYVYLPLFRKEGARGSSSVFLPSVMATYAQLTPVFYAHFSAISLKNKP